MAWAGNGGRVVRVTIQRAQHELKIGTILGNYTAAVACSAPAVLAGSLQVRMYLSPSDHGRCHGLTSVTVRALGGWNRVQHDICTLFGAYNLAKLEVTYSFICFHIVLTFGVVWIHAREAFREPRVITARCMKVWSQ